jgi:hypothetical protein
VNCQEGAAGRNIQSGSEFEKIPPVLVMASYKYWNSQGQACPLSTLHFRFAVIQRGNSRAPGCTSYRIPTAKHYIGSGRIEGPSPVFSVIVPQNIGLKAEFNCFMCSFGGFLRNGWKAFTVSD